MYLNKPLESDKFITHEVSVQDINKAFDYIIEEEVSQLFFILQDQGCNIHLCGTRDPFML